MKKINSVLIDSCLVALIGILIWLPIYAVDDEGVIAATVTAKKSAVSVTDGSVAYGQAAWSAATSTNPVSGGSAQTQTATNDGSLATFNIKSSQATTGVSWTMVADTSAIDEFEHYYSTTTAAAAWVQFDLTPTTYKTASTSVIAEATMPVDLKIVIPDSTTDFVQKTITVTVQVVAD